MARIFISYRRDDSSGYAGRLYDELSKYFGKNNVFMDIDTVKPGVDFVEAIEQAISASDILLVLIGKHWLTVTDAAGQQRLKNPGDYVRLEIATALRRDARVIPVLLQGAAMPRAAQLPKPLKGLALRQAHELSDTRWRYDIDQLMTVLKGIAATLADLVSQFTHAEAQAAWDTVIELGERILQIDAHHQPTRSKTVRAYIHRGDLYDEKGEYDQAIADYTRAIELDPTDAYAYVGAYVGRGDSYRHKREYERAIADYTRAIELDPTDAYAYLGAYVGRGDSYEAKGEVDRAISDYTRAIELYESTRAYYSRGLIYKRRNDKKAARRDFFKAADLGLEVAKQELAWYDRISVWKWPEGRMEDDYDPPYMG